MKQAIFFISGLLFLILAGSVGATPVFEYPGFYSDHFGPSSMAQYSSPDQSLQFGAVITDTESIAIDTVTARSLSSGRVEVLDYDYSLGGVWS